MNINILRFFIVCISTCLFADTKEIDINLDKYFKKDYDSFFGILHDCEEEVHISDSSICGVIMGIATICKNHNEIQDTYTLKSSKYSITKLDIEQLCDKVL